LEKNLKETQKARMNLDSDVNSYENQLKSEMKENYENKMILDKKDQVGNLNAGRIERD